MVAGFHPIDSTAESGLVQPWYTCWLVPFLRFLSQGVMDLTVWAGSALLSLLSEFLRNGLAACC